MLLVCSGIAMTSMSWQKWADLVVDFGLKPYIAWRLSEGDVLYQDIVYVFGPFSSYLHGFLFKLFGPGIRVLAMFNLFLTAWLTGLIYSLFHRFADRLTATVAALAFLTVFAFGHYGWSGNFNFICAYSYELTQGVFLSFLAIHQLSSYLRSGRTSTLCVAGALVGLVFLTKVEVFVALATGVCAGWVGILIAGCLSWSAFMKKLGLFAVFLCLPSVVFMFYFSLHMPSGKAIMAVLQPWVYVGNSATRALPFYKSLMGTDAVLSNFTKILMYALSYSLLFFLVFALNHGLKKLSDKYSAIPLLLAALAFEVCLTIFQEIPWADLARPLPLILFGYGVYLIRISRSRMHDPKMFINVLPLLIFTVFSFVLLFKIILNAHVYHYGFALVLPGALLIVKIVLYDFPRGVRRISGSDIVYKALTVSLICFFFSAHVWLSYKNYRQKNYPVGTGADLIMDHSPPLGRGLTMQTALDFIVSEMGENDTFVTLPTAPMLNYLARRKISSGHLEFNPIIWMLFGEPEYLQSLEIAAPSHIILMEDNSSDFGYRYFGQDYGRSIFAWIMSNYQPIKQIGAPPFTGQGFGIQILRRTNR